MATSMATLEVTLIHRPTVRTVHLNSLVSYKKQRIAVEFLPSVEKPFGTLRTKKD